MIRFSQPTQLSVEKITAAMNDRHWFFGYPRISCRIPIQDIWIFAYLIHEKNLFVRKFLRLVLPFFSDRRYLCNWNGIFISVHCSRLLCFTLFSVDRCQTFFLPLHLVQPLGFQQMNALFLMVLFANRLLIDFCQQLQFRYIHVQQRSSSQFRLYYQQHKEESLQQEYNFRFFLHFIIIIRSDRIIRLNYRLCSN